MIILFGAFIGAAILLPLVGHHGQARPSARANLFAELDRASGAESRLVGSCEPRSGAVAGRCRRRYLQGLDTNLVQAGHPQGLDLTRLLGIKLVLAVLLGWSCSWSGSRSRALVVAAGVFFLPRLLDGDQQKDKRRPLIRDAAADTIDQLTIVRRGRPGLRRRPPACCLNKRAVHWRSELQRTVEDIRAGVPRDQALTGLR